MKKIVSLIKVSLNHDMNIFKINTKKQTKFSKYGLPIIFTIYIMIVLGVYSEKLIEMVRPVNLEFVVLTLFGIIVSFISLIEGIYKSGSLLFNCRDDDLLLSLPIKKETVLFIRIFKFYIFELLYNSLFILPAMIVYAVNVVPGWTFYLSSFIALFLLPIVPILLSCVIGFVITFLSSRFRGKNIFQTIFTTLFLLLILYLSFNMDKWFNDIVNKASSINDLIIRLYYPVGAYISLVNEFNIMTLIIYIISHMVILVITVFVLGKIYFKVNSGFKKELIGKSNKNYKIKSNSKMKSFIKKELNRFFSTPVFITNAGFGLVLFIISCVLCSIKFDSLSKMIMETDSGLNMSIIKSYLPSIMFGMICFSSLMTSITSSMISLEGKSFNLLKSLPIRTINIVLYKVLAALIIMIPCFIIGDIIIFIRFKFDIINILLVLIASILLPFISELIGIIINLKYPKIDAINDTEVVKQSMSSLIATFIGLGMSGITVIFLYMMLDKGISNNIVMLIFMLFYGVLCLVLWLVLIKTCDKSFNDINS